MLDSIKTLAFRRHKDDNPTPSNDGRRTRNMAHKPTTIFAVAATLVVAGITLFSSDALAIPCDQCGQFLSEVEYNECLKNCTKPGNKPPSTTKWCKKEKRNIPATQWTKDRCDPKDPGGDGPKCDGKHERKAKNGGCECEDDYAYFVAPGADPKTRVCKKECEKGERWDDNGVCKPVDKCDDVCFTVLAERDAEVEKRAIERHDKVMAAIAAIPDNFWLLVLIALGVWAHFITHVVKLIRGRKDDEDDGPPKCANCGAELTEDTKFCGGCGTPVEGEAPAKAASSKKEAPAKPAPSKGKGKAKGKAKAKTPPKLPEEQPEPEEAASDEEDELPDQDED